MTFRLIFLFCFAGTLYLFDPAISVSHVAVFLVTLVIVFVFDFYALKRLEFHHLLSVGINLLISLGSVFIIFHVFFEMGVENYLDQETYLLLAMASILVCIYLSIQVGFSSDYFAKKVKEAGVIRQKCLIDTSAIIDGRLLSIAESGFIPKSLVIPRFVIRELQLISDSTDHEKRIKGRRGLDLLKKMKQSNHLSIQISNEDVPTIKTVDSKLVALCKQEGYKVITTDFNLFKVAQLEGIEVMNINHLASLIKPNLAVGDKLRVYISKKGNNKSQGIAFFPDDTMIVVENGEKLIGSQTSIVIISYIQNESGRMAFAKVVNS